MMDKHKQRQVWQRVYAQPQPIPPIPKEGLRQCHRRLQQNLQFYENYRKHGIYGPAFDHLARQTREQLQMLQQILESAQ